MQQAERHRGVCWVAERPLTLDEYPVVTFGEIEHHGLDATGNKVADEAVNGNASPRDHDSRLARRREDR